MTVLPLLDLDPELADAVLPERRMAARAELLCRVADWPRGPLPPQLTHHPAPDGIGLLIVSGIATRRTEVAGRRCVELLGAGDVLRPSQDDGDHVVEPVEGSLRAHQPVRLAVLDRPAALRIARWPEVLSALFGKVMRRSRSISAHLALAQVPRVEDRLMVLLWHLADRFGRMTSDGVHLPLRLSHDVLGALIGAQRPTVTMALAKLEARGALLRRPDRTWLLIHAPDLTGSKEPAEMVFGSANG